MPSVTTRDGAVIYYEVDDGDVPWLTLLHGGLVASSTWRQQRPGVGRGIADGKCIVIDQRGQGNSTGGKAELTIDQLAEDVLAVWDEVGINESIALGFSMGGLVALEVARRAPQSVSGLVLESTPFGLGDDERATFRKRAEHIRSADVDEATAQQLVERALSEPFRTRQPEITREYRDAIMARNPGSLSAVFDAIASWTFKPPPEPASLDVLVIAGELDYAVSLSHAKQLLNLFPSAELVTLPQVGHTAHLEGALAFNHLVSEYVRLRLTQPLYSQFS